MNRKLRTFLAPFFPMKRKKARLSGGNLAIGVGTVALLGAGVAYLYRTQRLAPLLASLGFADENESTPLSAQTDVTSREQARAD